MVILYFCLIINTIIRYVALLSVCKPLSLNFIFLSYNRWDISGRMMNEADKIPKKRILIHTSIDLH